MADFVRAAICHHPGLVHPVVTLICKLDEPSEKQQDELNQHFIYSHPVVSGAKTSRAHCKVAFFLGSSSPGVLDWAWTLKSSLLHFQPMCSVLCLFP